MKRSDLSDMPDIEVKIHEPIDPGPVTFDVSADPSCTEYMRARGIDPTAATVPQICEALNASGTVSDRPLTVSADGRRLEVDMSFRPATPGRIEVIGGSGIKALGLLAKVDECRKFFDQQRIVKGASFFRDQIREANRRYWQELADVTGGDFVKAKDAMAGKRIAQPQDFGMTAWPRIYDVKYAAPDIEVVRRSLRQCSMMVLDKDDEEFTWHSAGPAPVLPLSRLSVDTLDLFTRGVLARVTWQHDHHHV